MPSVEFAKEALAGDGFRDYLKVDLRVREGEGAAVSDDTRIKDEIGRSLAYFDSEGLATIGIGSRTHSVFDEGGMRRSASPEEVEADFDINVDEAIAGAKRLIPTFDSLSRNRRMALANMVFQMGTSGVGKFENMIEAIADGDFDRAAREVLFTDGHPSKFAKQMSDEGSPRAEDMARFIREG